MVRRVDPDALFAFICDRCGSITAAQVCPEVAEPYDYHADWTADLGPSGDKYLRWNCNYCGLSRYREPTARHACPERPAEPVIDEAAYEVGREARRNHFDGKGLTVVMSTLDEEAEKAAITAAILKDRELRSESCGGSSERLSPASSTSDTVSVGGTPKKSNSAPAADPRRLTHEELVDAIATAREGYIYSAVADAQLAKARVTISEAEITKWRWGRDTIRITTLVALLRSNGVEVTP